MTSLNRWFLIVLMLQFGCLAMDHSISELEYEEDELRFIVASSYPNDPLQFTDATGAGDNESGSDIVFHPKFYDFKESPVGIPRIGLVRIDNRLKNENVKLISISGNSINFHSSFFADRIIAPGNSTSFEIVFLSREEGQTDAVLFIHTSKGLYRYHVRGVGLPNPYRLRPLVGAKIPVNGSYEPVITLHNPHDTRILVVEMLSSGTDFNLKLPNNIDEQGTAAWSIEPFQTKSVMQGSFQGKSEGNHTGFIRIKVNHTDVAGEYLMVPVEVQVSSSPGIYSPQELLDFGMLVRSDKPKTLSLNLINAQPTAVNIQSVNVKSGYNSAIRIEFRPVIVEPGISASTVVALITFDPSKLATPSDASGSIEVKSDCGNSFSIPFTANVLEGSLEYSSSSLGFFMKEVASQPRNFSVRNTFSTPVAVYEVSVNHPDIVQVDIFNQSQIISPGEGKAICTLKVQKKHELCDSKTNVQLVVKSNVTNLKLPITCYDGKLQLYAMENGETDFGNIELYSASTEYIAVQNKNPIEIRLKSWGSNSSWSQVELVGMQEGKMEDLSRIRDFDNLKKSLFLQPGHMAVFSIDIRRPTLEGAFYGESYITTDQNQTLRVPFRFMVTRGSVSSEPIFFDKSYPGKISMEKLYVTSTFNQTLNLVGMKSYPPSVLWFSASTLQGYPEIYPHRKSFVGKIHFDPRKFCLQDCYAGFSLSSEMGKDWIRGCQLNWESEGVDSKILDTLQTRFNRIKDEIVSNISVWIDTNSLSAAFKIKAQVRYVWPRLSNQKSVGFPLTAVGNETVMELVVQNPASVPVVFQAVLARDYGPSWTKFLQGSIITGNITEGELVFSFEDISKSSSHFNNNGIEARKRLQKYLPDPEYSVPGLFFILQPSSKVAVNLKFSPTSKEITTSLLLLRNNLTGIESVWLKGRAGTGQLTIGNGSPGSSLMFQLTENLLQGCDKETEISTKHSTPPVTVRRSFIARNIGEIPLDILSSVIYPLQGSWSFSGTSVQNELDYCEGYGYKILNCHPFSLQPNQTHSIDIAFTPDFTLSKARATLLLMDSSGAFFNYTLLALIPSTMLAKCAAASGRPWWEAYFKLSGLAGSVIVLLVAIFFIYFDSTNVISKTVLATVRIIQRAGPEQQEEGPVEDIVRGQRLDLRAVYEQVENRFRRHHGDFQGQKVQNVGSSTSTTPGQVRPNSEPQSSSNLRNRKGKKGSVGESNFQSPVASCSNSRPSTSDTRPCRTLDEIAVVKEVKRDVEEQYKDIPPKDVNASTQTINHNQQGNHKKKKNNHQQNGKGKKHSGKNGFFGTQNLQKKTEEETSSTTTESSNPDEVVQENLEKERKSTNRTVTGENKPKQTKRDKKGMVEDTNRLYPENFENFSTVDKRKSSGKKKEVFNHIGSRENKSSGSSSPKPEQPVWDTPRPPSGEGLSELSAQTEAFVMQRPSKRNTSGDRQIIGNCMEPPFIGNVNRLSLSGTTQQQMPYHMQGQQQRFRKPGVIGQPRVSQSQGNIASHSQGNFGSHSNPRTNSPNSSSGYPQINKYGPPPAPKATLTSASGSIWEADVLPDNGCDLWGRRTFEAPKSTSSGLFTTPTFPHPSNGTFGTSGVQNGYTSSSSGLTYGLTTAENEYTYTNPRPPLVFTSSNSTPTSNIGPNYSRPATYANREFQSDMNTNPWKNCSPYNNEQPPRSSQAVQNSQPGFGVSTSATSPVAPHPFLQRMRSDPSVRSSSASLSSNGRPYWMEAGLSNEDMKRQVNDNLGGNNVWLSGSGGTMDSSYDDWKAVGASRIRESQIWDSNATSNPRWPASFDAPSTQPNLPESLAVGSRLPLAKQRQTADAMDTQKLEMTREVEAGLGFNPFTSDIWNHNEPTTSSSGSDGWATPYSFNNLK